jgi:SAM-dependent methyltransferase
MKYDFREPLIEAAPLARSWATESCAKNADGGCALYHGTWPYVRLLELHKRLESDSDALIDRLRACARTGATRVLISGSADAGILALVLHAYSCEDLKPTVTLVDRCETPLRLGRWHAERLGATLSVHKGDILHVTAENDFDVVVSHSFLDWFDRTERARLLTAWHRFLRPGGFAVGSQRVYPGATEDAIVRRKNQNIAAMLDLARRNATRLGSALRPSIETLLPEIEAFLTRNDAKFAIPSPEALSATFAEAGFVDIDLSLQRSKDSLPRPMPDGFSGQPCHVRFTAQRAPNAP